MLAQTMPEGKTLAKLGVENILERGLLIPESAL